MQMIMALTPVALNETILKNTTFFSLISFCHICKAQANSTEYFWVSLFFEKNPTKLIYSIAGNSRFPSVNVYAKHFFCILLNISSLLVVHLHECFGRK